MPNNEGLIPSIQRTVRTAIGRAGDTAGDFVSGRGTTVQNAARRVDGLARSAGDAGKAWGRSIDGGGRALGGRVGDWGNALKDASGAPGKRASTPANPLGLRGKRTV